MFIKYLLGSKETKTKEKIFPENYRRIVLIVLITIIRIVLIALLYVSIIIICLSE